MFKLTEFESAEKKQESLDNIKRELEALKNSIDVLRAINVDFNCNPAESWDLILTTEFDTIEDMHTYASHPDHVAVGKNFIGPVKADRACVDYEVK